MHKPKEKLQYYRGIPDPTLASYPGLPLCFYNGKVKIVIAEESEREGLGLFLHTTEGGEKKAYMYRKL